MPSESLPPELQEVEPASSTTSAAPLHATGRFGPTIPDGGVGHGQTHDPKEFRALALGALGVVYGDIGTSPLYAIKECFSGPHGATVTPDNVLGILSLVFWSLTLVVVVKYLTFIMRADNHGEGGILALFALISPSGKPTRRTAALLTLGLFGAALLFGDGMITPAISVLSAIEGLEVVTPTFHPYVVPITIAVLIVLFMAQRFGTGGIGRVFGPAMLVWFSAIGVMGLVAIVQAPGVLVAVNPWHALVYFREHGEHGFFVLGSVVLAITGAEALYADMGHFGRGPIRVAWYVVVLPGLLLNYFGQGAMLLAHGDDPKVMASPFFSLSPSALLIPMVVLATVATVIASQALISGVFSLTQQAVQLGHWPRVRIVHTSGKAEGQIYIPEMNVALMLACVALVIGFQESGKLAAAYGIAVTGTMSITSLLFYEVARHRWGWSRFRAAGLVGIFLSVDLIFFAANVNKLLAGGWFPLAIGAAVFTIMTTWKRGRMELAKAMDEVSLPLDLFLSDVEFTRPHRVPGTAVFMTSNPNGVPLVLLHHFKHNKVLHETMVLLSIVTERVPVVPARSRIEMSDLGHGFHRVVARYGFMQIPDTMKILRRAGQQGLRANLDETSFYLGRETLLVTRKGTMARWRKLLFVFLSRNSRAANAFFGLPPNRVVEMGAQIEL